MNNLLGSGIMNNPGFWIGIVIGFLVLFGVIFTIILMRKKIAAGYASGKQKRTDKATKIQAQQDYASKVFADKNKTVDTGDNSDIATRMTSYTQSGMADAQKKEES